MPSHATHRHDWLVVTAFALMIALGFFIFDPTRCVHADSFAKQRHARAMAFQLCAALKQYELDHGALPTSDNAQILATLRETNSRGIAYFETKPRFLNTAGEIIDAWNTPYRIDTSLPRQPRVYSFGPDKQDNGGATGSDDLASW